MKIGYAKSRNFTNSSVIKLQKFFREIDRVVYKICTLLEYKFSIV